jgi:hypothetical protein
LGCSRRNVIAARIRAFQQIGSAMEFHVMRQVNVSSEKLELHGNYRSALELKLAPRLATLA